MSLHVGASAQQPVPATENYPDAILEALQQLAKRQRGPERHRQPVSVIGPGDADETECAAAYAVAQHAGVTFWCEADVLVHFVAEDKNVAIGNDLPELLDVAVLPDGRRWSGIGAGRHSGRSSASNADAAPLGGR